MRRFPVRAGVFATILVAGLLALCSSLARADDPVPAAPPGPTPSAPGLPDVTPKKMTMDDLEKRLLERPGAAFAMAGLKYAPAFAGLILIILGLARRSDEKKGLVARRRRDAIPPRAFRLEAAIPLSLYAALGGGLIVVPLYASITGASGFKNLPLEVLFGATAAGMIPVALAVAFGIRRGWAQRRAMSSVAQFGDASLFPSSPWPARDRWREGLLGFLISTFVVLVVTFATAIVMNSLGMPPEPQDLVLRVLEPKAPHEPWLIATFGVLVAPITEEYVFRGLLYPAIRDRSSRWVGALLSSALFGAVHQSWTAGPALFCLAMLLCYLYERTGSVWPGILVHVLNNATSLLPLFLLR